MIPPMTHPWGRAWSQPDHSAWLFDDDCVVLPRSDYLLLGEYVTSQPTGVYPGKVWRSNDVFGRPVVRWFAEVEGLPDFCRTHWRFAELVDP